MQHEIEKCAPCNSRGKSQPYQTLKAGCPPPHFAKRTQFRSAQMVSETLTKLSNYNQMYRVILPISDNWVRLAHFAFSPPCAQRRTLTGQFLAIWGGWGRMVPRLLSRNSEELRRKRLEKDKLFNPRDLVTCGRSRLLPAPPATSAFAFPYWPVNGTIAHNHAQFLRAGTQIMFWLLRSQGGQQRRPESRARGGQRRADSCRQHRRQQQA